MATAARLARRGADPLGLARLNARGNTWGRAEEGEALPALTRFYSMTCRLQRPESSERLTSSRDTVAPRWLGPSPHEPDPHCKTKIPVSGELCPVLSSEIGVT